MKRFTETQKWEDPWFRRLPLEMKLLWMWLCDRCDNAGVIDPDIELASFQIGYQYPIDTLSQFDGRLVRIPCGKWFIPKFIEFQYGNLSEDCKAHKPIFLSLEKHQIKGYPKGINTLQEKEKEKDTEKEPEKEDEPIRKKRFKKPTIQEIEFYCEQINAEIEPSKFYDYHEAKGWLIGKSPMKDWKAAVRTWKGNAVTTNSKLQVVSINDKTMERINSWFGRKPEELWTTEEKKAWDSIPANIRQEPQLEGMEWFYGLEEDKEPLNRRLSLITLLNNWPSELDKARNYARKKRGANA
jgi:hypothetical protein